MPVHADKTSETSKAAPAQSASPKTGETAPAPFADNRPDHAAFVQLQTIANRHSESQALQLKGVNINDDQQLEKEADDMGAKALQFPADNSPKRELKQSGPTGGDPVQRFIKIGKDSYNESQQRTFISMLQHAMPQAGYGVPNKFLKVVVNGLRGEGGVLNDQKFNSLEDFIDFVVDEGLVSPKITAKGVIKRSTKLGKRPKFEQHIINFRLKMKEKMGIVVAARHVIPSHLLGYAAENLGEGADKLYNWIEQYGGYKPPSKNPRILKQHIWHILHNHTGNLWIGNSLDNSAIGFTSGDIEAFKNKILKSDNPAGLVSKSIEELTESKAVGGLSKAMQEVRQAASGAFQAIVNEYLYDKNLANGNKELEENALNDLRINLAEVWEQVEGDVASFSMKEYQQVSGFIRELGDKPTLKLLSEFMENGFQKSIMKYKDEDSNKKGDVMEIVD